MVGGILKRTVVVHCRHSGWVVAGRHRLDAGASMGVDEETAEEEWWSEEMEMARRQSIADDKEKKEEKRVRQ